MSMNWIINQIMLVNPLTIVASIGGSWGLRELVDWWKRGNLEKLQAEGKKRLQSQKAEIDRELEIKKTQCQQEIQAHYLQTQLKTAAFYKAYPELYRVFKETEGEVHSLFYDSVGSQKRALERGYILTQKLAEHSLFFDDILLDACIIAKDLLMTGIRLHSDLDKKAKDDLIQNIYQKIDCVRNLMRLRLLKSHING